MKTYLLLRSNKQTGPYSFDELLTLGLRAQDLLWVEGKSASWRYPSELDEFRAHVPVPVVNAIPDSKKNPAPAEATPVHHGTATVNEPTPEKETFHFHPRIRTEKDSIAFKETMHIHPRLNGGQDSFQQGEEDTHAFPTLSRFMQSSAGQPETGSQEIIGGPVGLPGMDAPAFHPAKPPADAEDEVPSLALQAPAEPMEQPGKSLAEVSAAPRIKVTLPAAVADKTMVIIHPREQLPVKEVSAPEEQLQKNVRRPVLEFLDEPASGSTAPEVVEPALTSLPEAGRQTMEPLVDRLPDEEAPLIVEPVSESFPPEEVPVIVELVSESIPAIESAVIPEPRVPHMEPASSLLSPEPEFQPASAPADSGYTLPSVHPKDTAGILQKIAVAAAIVSLVSVAALIANSVFNPNAYNYETRSKPAAPVRKLPATQTGNGAAMAPGNQDGPGRTVASDSDQSIKSETSGNPPGNQAKPAVKKIE